MSCVFLRTSQGDWTNNREHSKLNVFTLLFQRESTPTENKSLPAIDCSTWPRRTRTVVNFYNSKFVELWSSLCLLWRKICSGQSGLPWGVSIHLNCIWHTERLTKGDHSSRKYFHKFCVDLFSKRLAFTFTTLWATSADNKLMIFFLFFPENRIWHFMQTVSIAWNTKMWFLEIIKKNISICRLLKILPNVLSVKGKKNDPIRSILVPFKVDSFKKGGKCVHVSVLPWMYIRSS